METIKWVLCPICGNKTRTMMQEDTELKNFPLYCPKCKQQTFVVNRYQVIRMKDIVHDIDPAAFIIISEVADIFSSNNE